MGYALLHRTSKILSPLAPVLWGEGLGVRGLRASFGDAIPKDGIFENVRLDRVLNIARVCPSPRPVFFGRGEGR